MGRVIAQAVSRCFYNYRHLSDIKSKYTSASVDWLSLAFVFAIKFTKLRMHTCYIPDSSKKKQKKLTHATEPRHGRRLVMRPSQSSLHIYVPWRGGLPCILLPPVGRGSFFIIFTTAHLTRWAPSCATLRPRPLDVAGSSERLIICDLQFCIYSQPGAHLFVCDFGTF
jgi:hypothetical protein